MTLAAFLLLAPSLLGWLLLPFAQPEPRRVVAVDGLTLLDRAEVERWKG